MLMGSPHRSLIETLEADSFPVMNPTLRLIKKTWQASKIALGYKGLTEYSPLWDNKKLAK